MEGLVADATFETCPQATHKLRLFSLCTTWIYTHINAVCENSRVSLSTPAELLTCEKKILIDRMWFIRFIWLNYYEFIVPICDWRNRGLVI